MAPRATRNSSKSDSCARASRVAQETGCAPAAGTANPLFIFCSIWILLAAFLSFRVALYFFIVPGTVPRSVAPGLTIHLHADVEAPIKVWVVQQKPE